MRTSRRSIRSPYGNHSGLVGSVFNKKKSMKQIRLDHCKVCTQCSYWHKQMMIYKRKINKHIEQVNAAALNTAQFNSLNNAKNTSSTKHLESGTLASFGASQKRLITRGSTQTINMSKLKKHKSSAKSVAHKDSIIAQEHYTF